MFNDVLAAYILLECNLNSILKNKSKTLYNNNK